MGKELQKNDTQEVEVKEMEKYEFTFSPAVDIYEGDNGIVLKANLPGVAREDVSVNIENGLLKIEGKLKNSSLEGYRPILQEYREGSYSRSFRLSDEIDVEKIKADYKHGVLTLNLPKTEKAKTRQISID